MRIDEVVREDNEIFVGVILNFIAAFIKFNMQRKHDSRDGYQSICDQSRNCVVI